MKKRIPSLTFVVLLIAVVSYGSERAGYRPPDEIHRYLKSLTVTHSDLMSVETIGRSPGRRPIDILTIGETDDLPAILVIANMEGSSPPATRAAIRLIDHLTHKPKDDNSYKWFVLPVGNPDGYSRFFESPLQVNPLNQMSVNRDMDDAADEDPNEDLNRDGYITLIRQIHPEGEWVEDQIHPSLMRKADPSKGERGKYRLVCEGIDNDGDGLFNEDGPGGVNPGWNFPHRFSYYNKDSGLWPAYTPETRAVLEFAFSHPEVAMVLVLGRSNTLRDLPDGAKNGKPETLRVPGRWARRLGLDPSQAYPVSDLLKVVRTAMRDPEMTEDQLIQRMNGDPAMKVDQRDLPWWKRASENYKEFMKRTGGDRDRLPSQSTSAGSVEEWAYFQFGVPSFALDFWSAPVVKDTSKAAKKKKASDEQSLYAYNPDLFVKWTSYKHPQLGDVEIGGLKPFAGILPSSDSVDVIIQRQLPVIEKLVEMRAQIDISRIEVLERSKGVWQVDAWIVNNGVIPWPTYQGARCCRPTPVIATVDGSSELLEGRRRTVLQLLKGNGGAQKVRWVVSASEGSQITLNVNGYGAGKAQRTISLKGGVQ